MPRSKKKRLFIPPHQGRLAQSGAKKHCSFPAPGSRQAPAGPVPLSECSLHGAGFHGLGSCRRLSCQKAARLHEYFISEPMCCAAENIWLGSLETSRLYAGSRNCEIWKGKGKSRLGGRRNGAAEPQDCTDLPKRPSLLTGRDGTAEGLDPRLNSTSAVASHLCLSMVPTSPQSSCRHAISE